MSSAFHRDDAYPHIHRGQRSICPFCGKAIDSLADMKDHGNAPRDGNAIICLNCTGVGILEGGHVRIPTEAEHAELDADPNVREHIATAKRYWREQG